MLRGIRKIRKSVPGDNLDFSSILGSFYFWNLPVLLAAHRIGSSHLRRPQQKCCQLLQRSAISVGDDANVMILLKEQLTILLIRLVLERLSR